MFFVNTLLDYKICPDKQEMNKDNFVLIIIVLLYANNLSDFLAIIPYFIRKKLLNKKKENIMKMETEDNKTNDDLSLIYTDNKKLISDKKKKKIILYCIVLGICGFLKNFILILYGLINEGKEIDSYTFSCIVPLEIILQFICSYFILEIHFYKLQYFSLFLNLGIFIII